MPKSGVQSTLVYHFCRLRLPRVALPREVFRARLEQTYARYERQAMRSPSTSLPLSWEQFLENLHALDWFLATACLEGITAAWETLFASRASRTDALLIDALRGRAIRLYPRDADLQEEAVTDFWGYLLAGEREGSVPILARYDGQRPLVPWLIRVFQNKELSQMRKKRGEAPLPEDDLCEAELSLPETSDSRWHEQFREAAREWFHELSEEDVLLLGLRLRYKISQREVARLLDIHEGNVTRRLTNLSRKCHDRIARTLQELGWTGDDLYDFIRKEMYSVLLEEPGLAGDRLAALLATRGKVAPPPETADA